MRYCAKNTKTKKRFLQKRGNCNRIPLLEQTAANRALFKTQLYKQNESFNHKTKKKQAQTKQKQK